MLAKRNKKGINLEELLAGLLTVGLKVMMMVVDMMIMIIITIYQDIADRISSTPRNYCGSLLARDGEN